MVTLYLASYTAKLVDYAKTNGIYNALAIVEQMNNPHFEDDFHDVLVKEHLFPEK